MRIEELFLNVNIANKDVDLMAQEHGEDSIEHQAALWRRHLAVEAWRQAREGGKEAA